MAKYARIMTSPVPQTKPLDERQVPNNAGGFVYTLDKWKRLERFLILGSDSNTYYQKAKALTKENAKVVEECWLEDASHTVETITEISFHGRAPKNDAAIFALALGSVSKHDLARKLALIAIRDVCRTATHLFQFVTVARALGKGWGRAMKRAVADWYDGRQLGSLAYQAVKYRAREGYDHKRLLKVSRPAGGVTTGNTVVDEERNALYRWLVGKPVEGKLPAIVEAHLEAMGSTDPKRVLKLVEEYNLPWEAIPTAMTKERDIWLAMLPKMGLTALVRNLGKMTSYGCFQPFSEEVSTVIKRLADPEELKRARIHPFNLLVAGKVYASGKGFRGSLTWTPNQTLVAALAQAFVTSFRTHEPAGARMMIGLDVSGSMSAPLMDSPLSVCEGATALALLAVRTEPDSYAFAFNTGLQRLPFHREMGLGEALRYTRNVNFGGTDCALPMLYAAKEGLKVDVFHCLTDNETWAGSVHPTVALRAYREKSGINAKLVVTGMTSQGFTIADPNDAGMLDVVGFDSDAPSVIAEFCRPG